MGNEWRDITSYGLRQNDFGYWRIVVFSGERGHGQLCAINGRNNALAKLRDMIRDYNWPPAPCNARSHRGVWEDLGTVDASELSEIDRMMRRRRAL